MFDYQLLTGSAREIIVVIKILAYLEEKIPLRVRSISVGVYAVFIISYCTNFECQH